MKILFFNLNYARNDFNGILDFIKNDFDILCFQEIKDNIEIAIDALLVNYLSQGVYKDIEGVGEFNLKIFVKNTFNNVSFEVYNFDETLVAPSVLVKFESGNSKWNILNFHGTPQPGDKLDNSERLLASQNLIEIMKKQPGRKIIGGDFNLLPETKSVKMFEAVGYRNLITEFQIPTTRNENAWKLYPENKQLFADQVFVSRDISVKEFQAITNLLSDHLPLILEI